MKQPAAGSGILRVTSPPVPAERAIQLRRSRAAYRAIIQPPVLDCVSHRTLGGIVMNNNYDVVFYRGCPAARACKSATRLRASASYSRTSGIAGRTSELVERTMLFKVQRIRSTGR